MCVIIYKASVIWHANEVNKNVTRSALSFSHYVRVIIFVRGLLKTLVETAE